MQHSLTPRWKGDEDYSLGGGPTFRITRRIFFSSVGWSFSLVTVSSFTSFLTTDDGFRLSGEAALGVDVPLVPPSCFLSRSFIESAGAGGEYFGTDFPPSMISSNVMARSSHGRRGAIFDRLPPRRFLVPLSTYKCAFYSLAVTARLKITHIV